jgi:phage/plasmid-like protein (TIGR03299 family)
MSDNTNNLFVATASNNRQAAWSGLGTAVNNASSSEEAISVAGLDWNVGQAPIQWMDEVGTLRVDDSFKVNYRDDCGDLLGVVTKRYKVVQNLEAFSFVDHLLGEGVKIETVGILKGGRATWMLAKMSEQKILRDDFAPYLLLINSHDGSRALTIAATPIRLACWNTLNLALASAKQKWSFKHTANIGSRLQMAQRTMGLARNYLQALSERAEKLAQTKMSRLDFERYVEALFPLKGSEIADKRMEEKIECFRKCYEMEDVSHFVGTQYGFLLAMADYVSHKPLKNERQRWSHFENAVMKPADLLTRATALFAL